MQYQTPGVYVEEISALPPSVVGVATAVPAFIGYTEKAVDENGNALKKIDNIPVRRIASMLEYRQYFGGPKASPFEAAITDEGVAVSPAEGGGYDFILAYAVKLFFDNGGGPCYIVSIGDYMATPQGSDFEHGLKAIEKVDEPTLLLFPDAVNLTSGYYAVCNKALGQCQKLGDRFAVMDVPDSDTDASSFRKGIRPETDFLKYGAAYMPFLHTQIPFHYLENKVLVQDNRTSRTLTNFTVKIPSNNTTNFLTITYAGTAAGPKVVVEFDDSLAPGAVAFSVDEGSLTVRVKDGVNAGKDIAEKWADSPISPDFTITRSGTANFNVQEGAYDLVSNIYLDTLNTGDDTGDTVLYSKIKTVLGEMRATLPPSAAVAGIYAQVDRTRGVWKAPANVGIVSVIAPTRAINDEEQDKLNVDATSGKSINVIRAFAGKGTLIWGGRTLAGNDNEWRYVNVRRLFILIEESIQKATAFAVFEANDATTWLKAKSMIDSFLYGLWQQGALAGATADAAYYVNVGLGTTMTQQDILEGRMIIEVGVAAVRPAEFIILRFFHKMQES